MSISVCTYSSRGHWFRLELLYDLKYYVFSKYKVAEIFKETLYDEFIPVIVLMLSKTPQNKYTFRLKYFDGDYS